MIYKFDNIVEQQIDFYYDINHNICDFNEFDKDSYNSNNSKIYRYGNEIISDNNVKKILHKKIDNIRSKGDLSFLSTSTISPSEYEFHPLVNIHLHWFEYYMRDSLSWNSQGVLAWPSDLYNPLKKLYFNKTIKSIFSVRKELQFRNYLFSKITSDKNCIFRYAKYLTDSDKETKDDLEYSEKFPTWENLQKEYDKSIFAFVYETENGNDPNLDCQISEKTLLSFMNGNIPIIMGQKNMIKLLKNIGFYVWNDEFGFEDGDNEDDYYNRIDKFIDCYNNIKKLTFEESKKIWLNNQDKIQKNYDIASNLIVKKWN